MGDAIGLSVWTIFVTAVLLRAVVVVGEARREVATSGRRPSIGGEPGTWNIWLSV